MKRDEEGKEGAGIGQEELFIDSNFYGNIADGPLSIGEFLSLTVGGLPFSNCS